MSDDDDDDDHRRDEELGSLWIKLDFHTDEEGDVRVKSDVTVLVRENMTIEDLRYITDRGFYEWRGDTDELGDNIYSWMESEPAELANGTSTVPFKE